jgi:hypothetical protein
MTSRELKPVLRHIRTLAGPPATTALTDSQLLRAFAGHHDEAAFEALVQRHGPLVLSVCRRVLRQEQDAEDAFQATFLVLARKAASIRQGAVAAELALRRRVSYCLAPADRRFRKGPRRHATSPTATRPAHGGVLA